MTARRDPDHLIRTYLDDGPTELPDYSYHAVRARIDHTRQRVVFGPWREPDMSKFVALATAAAAVLVVAAVVGLNLLPGQGPIGGPGPTSAPTPTPSPPPAASPTASPTQQPSPSPTANTLPTTHGELAAGTYYIDRYDLTQGARLTFTLPTGWAGDQSADLTKDGDQPGELLFTPWWVTHVFRNACQWEGTLVEAGSTVDELVTALAAQEGREASAPTDVTVGGFPATRIELTVPADLDTSACTNGNLRYWPGPGPDLNSGLCCNPPGNTDVVYVVDVDGRRLVIVARHYPDSSAANRAELQAIVDSIQIEP
jgi:hypothetical protein